MTLFNYIHNDNVTFSIRINWHDFGDERDNDDDGDDNEAENEEDDSINFVKESPLGDEIILIIKVCFFFC